jgi:hypothetical protein
MIVTRPASSRRLFVASPSYNGWQRKETAKSIKFALRGENSGFDQIIVQDGQGSLLAYCFNQLLCTAINTRKEHGWTHFAMHHADVSADFDWADTLLDEMLRLDAAMISAVIPIKDPRGLTTTGVSNPNDGVHRLTVYQAHQLPETFDGAEASKLMGFDPLTHSLAVNTGLFLCDLDKIEPHVRTGKLFFAVHDTIREEPNGLLTAVCMSEDWLWSYMMYEIGLKVFATRKVGVSHHGGEVAWDSRDPTWGENKVDPGDKPPGYGKVPTNDWATIPVDK